MRSWPACGPCPILIWAGNWQLAAGLLNIIMFPRLMFSLIRLLANRGFIPSDRDVSSISPICWAVTPSFPGWEPPHVAGSIALLLRRNTAVGAALAILAVPLIAWRTSPRADMFSVVLFAAFFSLLWENYRTGRARLWLLPLLMLAWRVNLHLEFLQRDSPCVLSSASSCQRQFWRGATAQCVTKASACLSYG